MAARISSSKTDQSIRIPLSIGVRVFLIVTIAVIAPWGLLLYVLPGKTATYWMWVMQDPRSAMLFGPVYLGACIYYLLALRENDWMQVQSGLQGLFVASFLLLIPVALNWDVIRPYHPMTLIWLPNYYAPLFLVPMIWRAQEQRTGPPVLRGIEITPPWRTWLIFRGVSYLALTVISFIFAGALSTIWPWDVGALNLQMFLGQPAGFVLPALAILSGNHLWQRQRFGMIYAASLGVLQLLALVLAPSPYNWSAPLALFLPLVFLEWIATPLLMFLRFERRS